MQFRRLKPLEKQGKLFRRGGDDTSVAFGTTGATATVDMPTGTNPHRPPLLRMCAAYG